MSPAPTGLAVLGELIEADYRIVAAMLGLLAILVALYLVRKRFH